MGLEGRMQHRFHAREKGAGRLSGSGTRRPLCASSRPADPTDPGDAADLSIMGYASGDNRTSIVLIAHPTRSDTRAAFAENQ